MARKKFPLKKKVKKPEPEKTEDELLEEHSKNTPILKYKGKAKQEVPFSELKMVIADSLERVGWGEKSNHRRLNLEEYWGFQLAMALMHGYRDDGRLDTDPVGIVEYDYDEVPLCKEHR